MSCSTSPKKTVNFTLELGAHNSEKLENGTSCKSISHFIELPLAPEISLRELTHQILKIHNVPLSCEKLIYSQLANFIDQETDAIYLADVRDKIKIKQRTTSATDLMSEWGVILKEAARGVTRPEYRSVASKESSTPFPVMYHALIHSGAYTKSLIDLENSYALAISSIIEFRDRALGELHARQNVEMEDFITKLGISKTEIDVNQLSCVHLKESENLLSDCNRRISRLKATQISEFRDWIKQLYEDLEQGKMKGATRVPIPLERDLCRPEGAGATLEESFTINLGAQLKTSHNLRLVACDILSLCRIVSPNGQVMMIPQRLQTAMSLYSHSLSALVLLVDDRIASFTGISKSFAAICNQTTELHFDNLDEQLNKCHEQHQAQLSGDESNPNAKSRCLNLGDFYVTRHSNLAQVHVVYHIASDDSIRSADLNSRHSVILGLRNVLKSAHLYDVKALFIPLFLTNEMTDDMTIEWCVRRAELVLKCVKGFLIESASLTTADETRTLNFLVPHDISEELFTSLSHLLPTVFRMANPLVLS